MNDRVIVGAGTAEPVWLDWLAQQPIALVSTEEIVAGYRRLVVIAPHPDDEILACGGLLAYCAKANFPVLVVAVTDGEASHGLVDTASRTKLKQQRVHEQSAGLAQLGIDPAAVVRLHLPDGGVAANATQLFNQLLGLLEPGDLVVTTWQLDGHPDHEATARAVLATGATVMQAPVWMWHWSAPNDQRVPWATLFALALAEPVIDAKHTALAQHHSQLVSRKDGLGPVLVSSIVQRATRRYEYFFCYSPTRLIYDRPNFF